MSDRSPIGARPIGRLASALWIAVLLAAAAAVILPVDPSGSKGLVVPGSAGAFLFGAAARCYTLVKAAILWVPVGFVFALGGGARVVGGWIAFVVGALMLLAVSAVAGFGYGALTELLFAFPGLGAGLWLGGRTRFRPAGRDSGAPNA